jgi:ribosomal protein S18 acetylase RimI-like enzyme
MHNDGMQVMSENHSANLPQIEIRPLQAGEDATAFRTLNEEWITRHFTLEEKDREILGDPEGKILKHGGHILMVWLGHHAVGCVALIPMGDGVYELSKMAVSPEMRGLGIGRKLLLEAITLARQIGTRSLFLGSNSKLQSAVHLYESVGFRHVPAESIPDMPYVRANVFMELPL